MSGKRDDNIEVDAQGKAYVHVGGIRAEVVTPFEAENAAFVVCSPVSYFPDDVHSTCAFCNEPIVHRPHVPTRPPKLCIRCASTAIVDSLS